eukprot:GHVL01010337.1.p1 GENE.GHVL01010337.1~~GHVL01010337.1.p1  ORF type:complete len:176 (+),score=15.52 GHVL01010337.1:60-587(+)
MRLFLAVFLNMSMIIYSYQSRMKTHLMSVKVLRVNETEVASSKKLIREFKRRLRSSSVDPILRWKRRLHDRCEIRNREKLKIRLRRGISDTRKVLIKVYDKCAPLVHLSYIEKDHILNVLNHYHKLWNLDYEDYVCNIGPRPVPRRKRGLPVEPPFDEIEDIVVNSYGGYVDVSL